MLIKHAHLLEEIQAEKFEYIPDELKLGTLFHKLVSLKCNVVSGEFSLKVPQLRSLTLSTDPKMDARISLKDLPLLNRLEIDCGLHLDINTERKYPQIISVENRNLTEREEYIMIIENLLNSL